MARLPSASGAHSCRSRVTHYVHQSPLAMPSSSHTTLLARASLRKSLSVEIALFAPRLLPPTTVTCQHVSQSPQVHRLKHSLTTARTEPNNLRHDQAVKGLGLPADKQFPAVSLTERQSMTYLHMYHQYIPEDTCTI